MGILGCTPIKEILFVGITTIVSGIIADSCISICPFGADRVRGDCGRLRFIGIKSLITTKNHIRYLHFEKYLFERNGIKISKSAIIREVVRLISSRVPNIVAPSFFDNFGYLVKLLF